MDEAIGSLNVRKINNKGKKYLQYSIYLPSSLVNDSSFPFDLKKQDLKISIEGDNLIVSEGIELCENCDEYVPIKEHGYSGCEDCGTGFCKSCSEDLVTTMMKETLCQDCAQDRNNIGD